MRQRSLFLLIYRIFIAPVGVILALTLGALFIPKVREGLRLRRVRREWPVFSSKPVWIHASSGEFEYAKPFVTELKKRDPHRPIVVTYFTPSFAQAIAAFPGVDFSLPLPLDLPGPTRQFLSRLKPQAGFIARTDLWPELLHQAASLEIPLFLFSVTKTRKPGFFARIYQRWLFGYLRTVYCVSPQDLDQLQAVVQVPATAIGDTRFDQVQLRLKSPKPLRENLKPEWERTLVAGSTWPEDESVVLDGLQDLLRQGRLKLILAPHEPSTSHLEQLQEKLRKQKSFLRFVFGSREF